MTLGGEKVMPGRKLLALAMILLALLGCQEEKLQLDLDIYIYGAGRSFGSYQLEKEINPQLATLAAGEVQTNAITLDMTLLVNRFTDLTSYPAPLVPSFTKSPKSVVSVDGVTQISGETTQNFHQPITYQIRAENGHGKEYIVTASPSYNLDNAAQIAYLKSSNADTTDAFGIAVALDGDLAVVGAYAEASNQTTINNDATSSSDNSAAFAGAVYIYRYTNGAWAQEAYLKAPNGEAGDQFGITVGVSGDTVIVGAQGESSAQTTITNGTMASADNTAAGAGAVYVFRYVNESWAQEAYLKAPNAETNDLFGHSLAIDGDRVIVGAFAESSNQTTVTNGATASADNTAFEAGAAYIFERTGTSWAHRAYLKAPNAAANDRFGIDVGISGDRAIVAAYLEDSAQTTVTNGSTASVDNTAADAGAAYIFSYSNGAWGQEAYLKASNAETVDQFGFSVAIQGTRAVVGAVFEDSNQTIVTNGATASADNTALSAGAAYVFSYVNGAWAQEAYLKSANTESSDNFGYDVAIAGDRVVVSANLEDSAQTTVTNGATASADNSILSAGAVYVYNYSTSSGWVEDTYLKASNAETLDEFGRSIAINKDLIIISAWLEDSAQTTINNDGTASANNSAADAGAVYIFR